MIDESGVILSGIEAANYRNRYYTQIDDRLSKEFTSNWVPSTFFDALCKKEFSFHFVMERIVKESLKNLPIYNSWVIREFIRNVTRNYLFNK